MYNSKLKNGIMKKFLTFILVVLATFAAGRAQMRYQSQNAPDVEVTLVSGGVVINLDGTSNVVLFSQGYLGNYIYFADSEVNALFTADYSLMLLYVDGQTYSYALTSGAKPVSSDTPGFKYAPGSQPGVKQVPSDSEPCVPDSTGCQPPVAQL